MSGFRRKFQPVKETRELRTLFIIAVEGDRTEKEYFDEWHQRIDSVSARIEVIPPEGKNDPQRIFGYLKEKLNHFQSKDEPKQQLPIEYWMVIDRDQWPLEALTNVARECPKHGFHLCVSNPCFEFWLLLHFEKGKGIKPAESDPKNTAVSQCGERLRAKRYLIGYHKGLTKSHLDVLMKKWEVAVDNAKSLDKPKCKDFPKNKTGSTLYKLIEKVSKFLPNEKSR